MGQNKFISSMASDIRLYYVSFRSILKGKVSSIMMMQTSKALKKYFNNVTLISPVFKRKDNISEDKIFEYYNLENCFDIKLLNTRLSEESSNINIYIQKFILNFMFGLKVFFRLLFKRERCVFVFRCYISSLAYIITLFPFILAGKCSLFFEVHNFDDSGFHNFILRRMDGLICISNGLIEDIGRDLKINNERMALARLGYNEENYKFNIDRDRIIAEYELNKEGRYAVYTGKVSTGLPEIDFYFQAAKAVTGINFLIIGGKPEVKNSWRKRAEEERVSNIFFTGYIEPSRISGLQMFADILLMFYDDSIKTAKYASPGKLMEYMITGKPIIASDIPSIREVLDNSSAYFVRQNDIGEFIDTVKNINDNYLAALSKGSNALNEVSKYNWGSRAKIIFDFITEVETRKSV
ncbi:MAG: glycosyltransferase [Ignavibacteria bacterium]